MNRIVTVVCAFAWLSLALTGRGFAQGGWTEFQPKENQRIVYVDDEATGGGTVYDWETDHSVIGNDPFQPANAVDPYATLAAAWTAITAHDGGWPQNGTAGWILLKRGGNWENESLDIDKFGPANANDGWLLIGAYGDPQDDRPVISHVTMPSGSEPFQHIALVSLHIRGENLAAIRIVREGTGFHIEDVFIPPGNGHGINVHAEGDEITNVTIRRSVIFGRHTPQTSNVGHRSGIFVNDVDGLLVEENIFWHNGWAPPGACPWPSEYVCPATGGAPTARNQNVYLSCGNMNATFIRNISADASNVGCHHRVNGVNDNNLYLRNNIGLHVGPAGSSTDPQVDSCAWPFAQPSITARWNVILDSRPQSPSIPGLGGVAGMQVQRTVGSLIEHNLIAHNVSGNGGAGINVSSHVIDTLVRDNRVYDWTKDGDPNGVPALWLSCNISQHDTDDEDNCDPCGVPGPCPNCVPGPSCPVCCEEDPCE